MMVEEVGVGVLVAGEKSISSLFLEGGSAGLCLGKKGLFFELLEGGVLGIENESCDEGKAGG